MVFYVSIILDRYGFGYFLVNDINPIHPPIKKNATLTRRERRVASVSLLCKYEPVKGLRSKEIRSCFVVSNH